MAEAAARRGRAPDHKCDVLVIGSGSAGLAAAITARRKGLDVLVIDKEPYIGGTSAVSGGWYGFPAILWQRAKAWSMILRVRAGISSIKRATVLIRNAFRFLENGPRMVAFFEQQTQVKFIASPEFPDYHAEASGGGKGRSILTQPYDGRALGAAAKAIAPTTAGGNVCGDEPWFGQ